MNERALRSAGRAVAAALAAGLGLACTWVQLSEEGEQVRFTNANEVVDCERLATTESTTQDEVWVFGRSEEKIEEELRTLARNQAAKRGGDTVVALDEPEEGSQSFGIYLCGD